MEMILLDICPACKGSGVLGVYSTPQTTHECPWCDSKGTVTPEVGEAFARVSKVTPGLFRVCTAWGTGERVERVRPRKA